MSTKMYACLNKAAAEINDLVGKQHSISLAKWLSVHLQNM